MVDEFHAGLFLEKKRTNSGLFMESTSKHSIYPPRLLPTSPAHRVRHVGNMLTVPHVHSTLVPGHDDPRR
jgi:hypothetical protein